MQLLHFAFHFPIHILLVDPQEEYEWENERQNEVIALYAAVRSDIFSKAAGQRWYLRENISNLQKVFQQLDNMEELTTMEMAPQGETPQD